jgi:SAM-dependent methyltransferase
MADTRCQDEKYYGAVPPASLRERVFIAARNRIYADFIRVCRPAPDDTILDVGVSDVLNDAANVLERQYPHKHQITALGLGDAREFRSAFPTVRYLQIEPNARLPFADGTFDIACSNAVLEHVGGRQNQISHVRELMRIASKVFVSVPNRYFPIEHHTALPVLHFHNRTFRAACRWLNKRPWDDQAELSLISKRSLQAIVPPGGVVEIGYTGMYLGPFSSNLFAFIDQTGSRPHPSSAPEAARPLTAA